RPPTTLQPVEIGPTPPPATTSLNRATTGIRPPAPRAANPRDDRHGATSSWMSVNGRAGRDTGLTDDARPGNYDCKQSRVQPKWVSSILSNRYRVSTGDWRLWEGLPGGE